MDDKNQRIYTDFSNVESQRNFLTAEEYPEGPYGSPINKLEPVENKSTPWLPEQRKYSAYNFENKTLHKDMPRQMEGAHPPHDDPDKSTQSPYTDYQK